MEISCGVILSNIMEGNYSLNDIEKKNYPLNNIDVCPYSAYKVEKGGTVEDLFESVMKKNSRGIERYLITNAEKLNIFVTCKTFTKKGDSEKPVLETTLLEFDANIEDVENCFWTTLIFQRVWKDSELSE